jgi:aryl-alcohol dehydrogenase (NADP+)
MMSWQFAKALYLADRHGWTRFASMQNHYNLVYREEEREMMPLCIEEGVGVIPWSPLARGFLAGNRRRGERTASTREETDAYAHKLYYDDADYAVADRVADVAREKGVSPAQVALAWLLAQPGVTAPIVGATKMEHLEQAVKAVDVSLSDEERRRLEEPYVPHKPLGF